jgi:hypothetical protein
MQGSTMSNLFSPGPSPNTVRAADGKIITVPDGWILVPPGDPTLTRRIKAAVDHYAVAEKKGRKVFSRGIWTAAATVERIRAELDAERSTKGFAKKKEADARRRDKAQAEYVEDFHGAVVEFLGFHENNVDLAARLARAVTDHATPVGSGTVARTKRIPVEQRAEAAVIAWMRHQTTGYDGMVIPRVKGKRREVRRMLAARSKELLGRYRRGEAVSETCPLKKALSAMTSPRNELLGFLRHSEATPAAKALLLKRTFQEFVLEYGWWYEPVELDEKFPTGTPQQCHKNAADLILEDDTLIYCEGYALFKSGSQPTLHSWVTDGKGRAIDNTWPKPGVAYVGVPFKAFFVTMTALKNHATVSLLDDFQNNYPLRGELGDRPDEWLELRGCGTERVGKSAINDLEL